MRQPVRHFGEVGKLGNQLSRKLPWRKAPLPIPAMQAGCIHASLAAQAQHILQRDQRELRWRGLRRSDERPMNPIVAAAQIGLCVAPFAICSSSPEPAHRRVIIVSSGINDFAHGTMRQIHVRAFVPESELQHRNARNLQSLPQRVYRRCDVTQVFREERQALQSALLLGDAVGEWQGARGDRLS